MRPIATCDCETDPFKRGRLDIAPFIWGLYQNGHYWVFYSVLDLVLFLEDKDWIVYAHNGGKFDWHFIISLIEPFTNLTIINGRLSKFKIGKCEFRDSYNIIPQKLADYQKTKINYNIFEKEERDKPKNKKKIFDYLKDDCIFLYELVTQFIKEYGCHLTLATAAIKQWQKISKQKPPNDHGGLVYQDIKPFYHGGRCQTFEYGIIDIPFKMVDIKSAYPNAMMHNHPIGLYSHELTHDEWFSLEDYEKGPTMVRVRCKSGGALPYRYNNSLFFPDDWIPREYYCTGWEVLAGLDTNTIDNVQILEAYYFPEQTSFAEYVTHFYELKNAAKINYELALERGDMELAKFYKAQEIFNKLFLNSLYGKYGANPKNYACFQNVPPSFLNNDGEFFTEGENNKILTWAFNGDFGDYALVKRGLEAEEQRFYNVATAASVSGFNRAFLWRALSQCKRPLYCDTDSIAAMDFGKLPNGFGKNLGQWELEGTFDSGAFCGRKVYAMHKAGHSWHMHSRGENGKIIKNYKTAHKGVQLTPAEIYRIAQGETITYTPKAVSFSVHGGRKQTSKKIAMTEKFLPKVA